ncbi:MULTISPECIES: hypothetical protein [unclassified Mesorhizobium]|uniref:hypothetical protein n=1 Tax=unclassified Mesorhizobium TaxID=325217 RepID=UPI000FE4920E|nr:MULTISPECIES: hypothetical protein [unclassified Mesorhizobium]RWE84943.1 MAG: hypothetical protein EOS49_18720 [Mesorhizobium sp.]RWK88287.1 MAG: hypothetical protein EOR45_29090 [Mesorhizobium sp.]TGQ93133.1 hypothetical protein EN851_16800 [Mesorhizobium sp. M8A.F.Ca.ET.208.01.1.1]TGT53036.1 hypothetical protein EN810_16790 [Mesorhizobium sp. M8A.F.Ca.ET.167.01.1.1]
MKTLGVLSLLNVGEYHGQHPDFGQGVGDARRYASPPIWKTITGGWARDVVLGNSALEDEYVSAARELVQEGADAITCDCGFTVRYQRAIAAAVSVPVSTSSLLLLPTLLSNVPANKKIAILTADSRYLDAGIFATLGIHESSRFVVEGLEGTATYAYMWAEQGKIHVDDVLADTDDIIARVQKHEDVVAILCECTIFPRVSPRIRRVTGLPVYDAANNAALLMAALS